MGSKEIIFLGLCLAAVLLITSEVTAKNLAETTTSSASTDQQTNKVNDAKCSRDEYHRLGRGRGYNSKGGHGGVADAKYSGGEYYERGGHGGEYYERGGHGGEYSERGRGSGYNRGSHGEGSYGYKHGGSGYGYRHGGGSGYGGG